MRRTRATALLLRRAEAASASLRHQQHRPQQHALRQITPFQTHADAAAAAVAAAAPVSADAPQCKSLSRTASLLRTTADAAARTAAGPTLSPAGLAGGSSGDGFAGAVACHGGGGVGGGAAADAGRPHNGNGSGNCALHLAAQLPLTLQGPSSCVQWDVTSVPMSSPASSLRSPWASTSFQSTCLPKKGQMWASSSSSSPSASSSTSPSSSSAPSSSTARSYSTSATDSSSTSSPQSSDSNRSSSSSGRGDASTRGGGRGRGVFDEDEEEEPVRATRQLVVTASGPDRPGLVSRLTKIVLDCGGNVEQSRMARLAGEFSVIMQLSVDARVPRVAEQLRERLMELQGLQVSTRWSTDDRTTETKPTRKFRRIFLRGADNPGLVYNVTEYLAANRINIENLETATEDAPFGGATLFTMEGVIAMPLAMSTQQLMRHLDVLQSTLGVQIELRNMDPGRRAEDLQEWQERAARPGGVSRYSVLAQREDDEEHGGKSGGGRGRGGDTLI